MIRPRFSPKLTIALIAAYAIVVLYGIDKVRPYFEPIKTGFFSIHH